MQEPSNSLYFKVLDLRSFYLLISNQSELLKKNVYNLIVATDIVFNSFLPNFTTKKFLILKECFIDCMKVGRTKKYMLLHLCKDVFAHKDKL